MPDQKKTQPKIFESLYFKVFLALLSISIGCELIRLSLSVYYSKLHGLMLEQQINWEVASEIARDLQVTLNQGLIIEKLDQYSTQFEITNPQSKLYILESSGKIVYPVENLKHDRVRLEPILKVLEFTLPELPLWNIDPLKDIEEATFSAAPVFIGSKSGYIYITLRSHLFDFLSLPSGIVEMTRELSPWLFVSILAAVLITGSFFLYLSRHFRTLLRAVRQFESAHLVEKPHIPSGHELEFLSRTVFEMADTITARKLDLELIGRKRKELIANIAHDLRGPLTAISGFLEIIQSKLNNISQEEFNHCLHIISRNTSWQQLLVKDLQELSSLEAKEQIPEITAFSIFELASELNKTLHPEAINKNIRFELQIYDDLPDVLGDRQMISRVMFNLVSNALRYTPEGGNVVISARPEYDGVIVEVSDSGIGIAEEELKYIYDAFYRANKGNTEDPGGTGLGLAIAQRIIQLHNSEIQVRSVVNQGTTFTFRLNWADRASGISYVAKRCADIQILT